MTQNTRFWAGSKNPPNPPESIRYSALSQLKSLVVGLSFVATVFADDLGDPEIAGIVKVILKGRFVLGNVCDDDGLRKLDSQAGNADKAFVLVIFGVRFGLVQVSQPASEVFS